MSGPVGYVPTGYSGYGYNRRPTDPEEYKAWIRKLNIKVRMALTNPHTTTAKGRLDAAIRLIPDFE